MLGGGLFWAVFWKLQKWYKFLNYFFLRYQGCQILIRTTYQNGKICAKWPHNLPNVHKIDLKIPKHTKIFLSRALENYQNLDFWSEKNHLANLFGTSRVLILTKTVFGRFFSQTHLFTLFATKIMTIIVASIQFNCRFAVSSNCSRVYRLYLTFEHKINYRGICAKNVEKIFAASPKRRLTKLHVTKIILGRFYLKH
jgi:hypothetical protein